jgi:hypothetical protein
MFVRLTGPARAKAGWFAALIYLFCVLAPGAALALGDAATCLMHRSDMSATTKIQTGVPAEHAAAHQHHAMQPHQHAMRHADAGESVPEPARHQHDGKAATGPCCAMLCVSAIASDPPVVIRPSQPMSTYVSVNFRRVPGEAPPLLFRPPIA